MAHAWMPLFWGDFLKNTLGLTTAEIGAYFLLIAHAWEHDGMVPEERAQRIARVSNWHWKIIRPRIEGYFEKGVVVANGLQQTVWYQPRVQTELQTAAEKASKYKAAALQMHEIRRANAHAMHPPPSPSQSLKKEGNSKLKGSKAELPYDALLQQEEARNAELVRQQQRADQAGTSARAETLAAGASSESLRAVIRSAVRKNYRARPHGGSNGMANGGGRDLGAVPVAEVTPSPQLQAVMAKKQGKRKHRGREAR